MTERYYRKTAAIVGALFIIATVTSIAAIPFLGTALDGPDYILELPDIENDVVMAAMLDDHPGHLIGRYWGFNVPDPQKTC